MTNSSPDAKLAATYDASKADFDVMAEAVDALREPVKRPIERAIDNLREERTLLNHAGHKAAAGVLLQLNDVLYAVKAWIEEEEARGD